MKKKGFTLIELLAVIVVLAIILVLAVPKILDLIEKADRQAYKESAELMAHTAQIQYQTKEVTGSAPVIPEEGIVYTFEEGVQTVSGNYDLLKFKGDKPYSGTITLTKDKKVIIEKLVSKNKKWCAIKEANEKQARVGRSTDPEFACVVEEDAPIVDKTACELEQDKDDETIYYIDSPSDLYAFSKSVNSGTNYSGKIVKIRNDLDMSDISNTCGQTSFNPIGKNSNLSFMGTFDGGAKTISNLTINGGSYTGLFGYLKGTDENKVNIYGIRLVNEVDSEGNIKGSISGGTYVGGLVGYVDENTNIKEIELDNIKISGYDYVGGFSGYTTYSKTNVNNILVKSVDVSSSSDYVGLVDARYSDAFTSSIVENGNLKSGKYTKKTTYSKNSYHSNNVIVKGTKVTDGFDPKGINDINFYESVGLDTWIGGDNDNSGYYFDYDENNRIILKNVKQSPITFNLSKEGENYLIKNEKDWKIASSKPQEKYKLENNLDFTSNKYYMLGSIHTPFSGTLVGNDKMVSNVTINGNKDEFLGMIGTVNSATIYGINLKNITINGGSYTGVFGLVKGTDENKANIYAIRMVNEVDSEGNIKGNISGGTYVGGLVGYVDENTNIKEIELDNIKISGYDYVGGFSGYTPYSKTDVNNILVKSVDVSSSSDYVGLVDARYSDAFTNSIVENGNLKSGKYTMKTTYSKNSYHSNNVIVKGTNVTDGFDPKGINDINFYESVGLDTWIGGDNDNSGYYFDYDENNRIILKNVKQSPITFNLSKEGENYLIKNEKDWKIASSKPQEKYKLENNLDFTSNKYYMLGSIHTPFSGTLVGNDKMVSNVTINGNKDEFLGMIGTVNSATIYGINLKNITINGGSYTGVFGLVKGTDENKANIYAIRMVNEVDSEGNIKGNISGGTYVGGLVGYVDENTNIKEIELDNIKISGYDYVGGFSGYTPYSKTDVNNILVKTGSVSSSSDYVGLVDARYSDAFTNSIVENVNLISGRYTMKTTYSKNSYHSNNVIVKGTNVTDGFASSLIGNLEYYAGVLETLYSGDSNGTGYFFDKTSDGQIHLVKAKEYVFSGPSSDDETDTNTEGGGTEADTCYITISCNGSGNYRNCSIRYYENGVSEEPYKNNMTLDLTRGSSCALYSPSNSPGGFTFYVKKKSSSSCSVTFRARSNADCVTTTYKTISF